MNSSLNDIQSDMQRLTSQHNQLQQQQLIAQQQRQIQMLQQQQQQFQSIQQTQQPIPQYIQQQPYQSQMYAPPPQSKLHFIFYYFLTLKYYFGFQFIITHHRYNRRLVLHTSRKVCLVNHRG